MLMKIQRSNQEQVKCVREGNNGKAQSDLMFRILVPKSNMRFMFFSLGLCYLIDGYCDVISGGAGGGTAAAAAAAAMKG